MIIHTMEQGSEAWKHIRKGKMTGSNAQTIATAGKGLETYVWKILAEKYATEQIEPDDSYTNAHMERGTRLEPQARSLYELMHDKKVDQVGFIELNEFVGTSPDGLCGDDELIEIKCHDNLQHFRLLVKGKEAIDPGYIWQIQMNLMITRRKIARYIAYNPNFKQSLLVFDVEANEEAFAKLEAGLLKGTELIQTITSLLSHHE